MKEVVARIRAGGNTGALVQRKSIIGVKVVRKQVCMQVCNYKVKG